MVNWRPPTLEELTIGLACQIIDKARSADALQAIAEVKKHFKREIEPRIIFKSHNLTLEDIEYYRNNPELIKRDLRINAE
jgi:hypothetical protein